MPLNRRTLNRLVLSMGTAAALGTALPAYAADPRVKFVTSEGEFVVEVYPDKVSPLIVHIHASCATAGGHVAGGGLRAGKAFRSVRIFMIPLDGSPA